MRMCCELEWSGQAGVVAAGPRGACVLPFSGAEGLEGGAALQLPVLVLLQQHRPHQARDGVVGGEDEDEELIQTLQQGR